MTKLKEFILLEYIKPSKKLQEIKCEKYHYFFESENKFGIKHISWIKLLNKSRERNNKKIAEQYPALTIYNIIDNSEFLFGKDKNGLWNNGIILVGMCQNDKSIQEISKYIIKNIKE